MKGVQFPCVSPGSQHQHFLWFLSERKSPFSVFDIFLLNSFLLFFFMVPTMFMDSQFTWKRTGRRERERGREEGESSSFLQIQNTPLSLPPVSFTGIHAADGEAHSAAGLTAGRTPTLRTLFFSPFSPPSVHSSWALSAAATTAQTACWWTRSRAPGRETLPPPRTAADLMTWSTAAMIPTASSPMSTGTCGGWGKGAGPSWQKVSLFSTSFLI